MVAWVKKGSWNEDDRVVFDSAIANEEIWLTRSGGETGNDLLVSLVGGTQTLTVSGWYSAPRRPHRGRGPVFGRR